MSRAKDRRRIKCQMRRRSAFMRARTVNRARARLAALK